ncbi:hypothetical protein ACWEVT_39240, partial [Saccharopolyspora sp. NPDC003762]
MKLTLKFQLKLHPSRRVGVTTHRRVWTTSYGCGQLPQFQWKMQRPDQSPVGDIKLANVWGKARFDF